MCKCGQSMSILIFFFFLLINKMQIIVTSTSWGSMRFNCPDHVNYLKYYLYIVFSCCVRVFQINRNNRRLIDWLILKNWLMQLKVLVRYKLESQERPWGSSSLMPKGLRPRKRRCFSWSPKAGKKNTPVQRWSGWQSSLLFREGSAFNWWDETPILGRGTQFFQSVNLNVNLIQKHAHSNTQSDVRKIFGHPVAQSSDT